MVDFPPELKRVWQKWNIRGTILFSLSMQTFLVLLAPYRKSTRNRLLIMLIWSAYLLADSAANFTVALISNSRSDDSPEISFDLLALWAPFLLLHLGGPDTITAFALEDNELWIRHFLGFGLQAVATLYVFAQTLPRNRVWIPTVLMFAAGTIKYVERTRALYLASLGRFRDSILKDADPGPNYAKIVEEYVFEREINQLPTHVIMIPEPDEEVRATDIPVKKGNLSHLEVVHYGYKYFLIFKGLVVDLMFSFRERNESREFFKKREAIDALRVIEVELNFIYEVLYTKVQVVHSVWGYIIRGLAFVSIVAALCLFHFRTNKHDLNQFDVGITYTLFLGAVVLDVIALLMLIFSDWTFASFKDTNSNSGILAWIFSSFLSLKKPRWNSCKCTTNLKSDEQVGEKEISHEVLSTPIIFRRWSGSLSSYNLISFCLKSHTSRIHKFTRWPLVFAQVISTVLHLGGFFNCVVCLIKKFKEAVIRIWSGVIFVLALMKHYVCVGITFVVDNIMDITGLHHPIEKVNKSILGSMVKDLMEEFLYVCCEPFTKELWKFIFEELKNKADYADDPDIAKRISAARGEWVLTDSDQKIDRSSLMQYITSVEYDESILLWHIATDLCYYTPAEKKPDQESLDYREFSKLLSDYMLYLLIWQPTLMSAVGGIGKIRFRDTCAEAERFFADRNIRSQSNFSKRGGDVEADAACEAILSVTTDVKLKPVALKGDKSKSVLFDASMLAQELIRLEEKGLDKWKLISRVWVELISYAASHCRANTHAQQVSKGGELVTIIWLLMAHLGLGEQFRFEVNEGFQRAKLTMGK